MIQKYKRSYKLKRLSKIKSIFIKLKQEFLLINLLKLSQNLIKRLLKITYFHSLAIMTLASTF